MTYARENNVDKQYRQIGIRHEIESASPHRLIQLMMERVLTRIALAKRHMLDERVAEKGRLIGSAIDIVSGLQASLNHDVDKKLSGNFDALYDYMTRRLVEANLKNEPQILDEVASLMGELKSAWVAIADRVSSGPAIEPAHSNSNG